MNKDITTFAVTNFRNKFQKFGIKTDDRRRHMYLIGKTGMGKSTIQENMIIEDIRAGKGVAVVDPHGDLAEKVMDYIPTSRINDVIYFNPADYEYPIAFNVVEQVAPEYRHLVASGLIGVFKKLWADSWGPRLEYILRNAILAILDYPGSTLLGITRMLSDKAFRKKVISKIQDPVVKAFWVNEFAGYADKFASEAVSPIQNKVGQFLSTSLIRNIVGQVKSSIDMRQIMDEGKILIMNLSKGRIGEDNSALLGAMMITKIQLAAMGRVNIPESQRKDFYLYIDEFQNFSTESFANILSEARKYRLNLIMAHQYIEQLDEKVGAAVFGNVGTMVVFRVGAADAEELVKEFTPTFTEEDLVNLPKYEFYIKLMIDGVASDPFSAKGLPPLTQEEKTGNLEKVIKVSRERYAKSRDAVAEKILRWHEGDTEKSEEQDKAKSVKPVSQFAKPIFKKIEEKSSEFKKDIIEQPRKIFIENTVKKEPIVIQKKETDIKNDKIIEVKEKEDFGFSAECSKCHKITKTPFKPDGVRPVYCKDCLSDLRKQKRDDLDGRKKAKQEELRKQNEEDIVATPPVKKIIEQKKPVLSDNSKNFGQVVFKRDWPKPNQALEVKKDDLNITPDVKKNDVKQTPHIEKKEVVAQRDSQELAEGEEINL